jgi:PAS domain S-box-containing protein
MVRPFKPLPDLVRFANASMARRMTLFALVPAIAFIVVAGGGTYLVLRDWIGVDDAAGSENALVSIELVLLAAAIVSVALAAVLGIVGGEGLVRPIRDLEEVAASVIAEGRIDMRVAAHGAREVVDLATTFNFMLDRLEATMNELRAGEARFRSVIDRSPSAIVLKDAKGSYVMVNRTAAEWLGHDPAAILDKAPDETLGVEQAARALDQDRRVRESGEVLVEEHEFTYADGTVRRVVVTKFPVPLRDGSEVGVGGIFTDVTEVRETADQLRHAQKMEAVGQLTGGVAHDFNNLLTVVLGNLELLRDVAGADRAGRPFIDIAIRAGERGAELTQRLLAFSRRHPLQPAATDVNAAIAGAIELIRRTLREDIAVSTALDHGTWRAMIDPGQLENALVNLAVNAQDAMPAGGELTIETGNVRLDADYARRNAEVTPGEYVMIAVTDSGIGMPQDVLRRAFEPFFTTKDVGKGSGLGLSMIYGFAKQSGGHVKIYSEVGHGTTVRIYLPRLAADDEEDAPQPAAAAPARATGGETILAVEDDPDVRQYVTHALRRAGYAVLEAENGPAALEILEGGIAIDLLFTDVIMPGGMNGRELADRAAAIRPRLKVLFSSGYSENAIVHHGRLDKGVNFLGKPYTRDDLARKVREVLDAAHRPLARATRSQEAAVAAHR